MVGWKPREGGTLFMPSGPQGDHLFVILCGPYQNPSYGLDAQYVLVPFCTVVPEARYETACLIQPGEHSFIRHLTYVDYTHASVRPEPDLCAGVTKAIFRPSENITDPLLARIQEGLKKSNRVARFIKKDFLS